MTLFEASAAKKQIRELRKLPFSFYYHFSGCSGDERIVKRKIVDWEAGALYWNCRNKYKNDWERYFRQKLEHELPSKDLMFLMGNQHKFPDQWMIVSLIYPPKERPVSERQRLLFP